MIRIFKGFGIVNKKEVDIFLKNSCLFNDPTYVGNLISGFLFLDSYVLGAFFDDPVDIGNLISGLSAFSKSGLNIWKFTVHIQLKPSLENLQDYFASV